MLTKGRPEARERGAAEEPDPTILDRAHLRQYTAGDARLEHELIGLFLSQLGITRTQLEDARTAAEWKFAAHSLKGSARSIGALKIALLAERLESLGLPGAPEENGKVVAELDGAMAAFAAEAEKLFLDHDPFRA